MGTGNLVIAVDLGGTKCASALINSEGVLVSHHTDILAGSKGADVAALIMKQIEAMLAHAALKYHQVDGIGISVPGISDRANGTVWAPNIEGWEKFPLHQYLKDHLTRHELPVIIESDRAASLLGEYWLGAAREARNAIYLAVGTGIGAGIISDGKLVRGAYDIAGAIGWMALQKPFESKYKRCGNFEYFASGEGLVRAALELAPRSGSRLFQKGKPDGYTAEILFASYEKKDPVARKVIDQAIELWGMACANLVSLFNPEVIVFGGGVFGPGLGYLERIYRESIKWAQPVAMRQVKYLPSVLKGAAPLLGAVYPFFKDDREHE